MTCSPRDELDKIIAIIRSVIPCLFFMNITKSSQRAHVTGTITPPTSYGIELCVHGNNNLT